MTDLDKLIEAVEAAEWTVTNWRDFLPIHTESDDTPGPILAHRAYHGSLDAAKALHDALLPGRHWVVGMSVKTGETTSYIAGVDPIEETVRMADPARAWLLAILKEYRAQVQP